MLGDSDETQIIRRVDDRAGHANFPSNLTFPGEFALQTFNGVVPSI